MVHGAFVPVTSLLTQRHFVGDLGVGRFAVFVPPIALFLQGIRLVLHLHFMSVCIGSM